MLLSWLQQTPVTYFCSKRKPRDWNIIVVLIKWTYGYFFVKTCVFLIFIVNRKLPLTQNFYIEFSSLSSFEFWKFDKSFQISMSVNLQNSTTVDVFVQNLPQHESQGFCDFLMQNTLLIKSSVRKRCIVHLNKNLKSIRCGRLSRFISLIHDFH